ncbi:MAG: SdpI family protein [Patescibacteria group bacterium]|nr:SdpI family protein [Patescibacteria group bacterium]MDE2437946.1 SdpI family protein [Patescibacteria group bacterium]
MNTKVSGVLICVIVLAVFITGALVYPSLGDFRLAFGLPITLLMLWGLWALLPAIDPIAKGFPGFRYVYDLFWILLSSFLAYSYALKLSKALGVLQIDVLRATLPALAALFFVISMLLPMLRRNWFFGIRTPWTLSSDEDWMKTHQFARPLFGIASLLIFIGTFMPRIWGIGLLVGPIFLAIMASAIYSYIIFPRK